MFKKSLVVLLAVLMLFSCGKGDLEKSKNSYGADYSVEEASVDMAPRGLMNKKMVAPLQKTVMSSKSVSKNESILEDRKIIKNANVTIEFADFDALELVVKNSVKSLGGYISNTNKSERVMDLTVRIPADKFDDFFEFTKSLGKVKNSNISVDDVTDRYNDLTDTITNKRNLLAKYRRYLNQASNLREILDVERYINDLTYQLKRNEDDLVYLKKQISLSTFYITVVLPPEVNAGKKLDNIGDGFKNIGVNIVRVLSVVALALIYFIILGIPAIALLFLIYYLLFGKVGLLRKLFRKIRSEKNV